MMQIEPMSAEWESDRAATIRGARLQGFLLGVGTLGCTLALLAWAIAP